MPSYIQQWKSGLIAIVLLAAVFRFFNLGDNSFVSDEFLDINSSYGYFKTGEWQAWDFNFARPDTLENANSDRDSRAAVYKWQVAQLFHFLAPTEAAARSVSAAWGIVSTVLVFYFTLYFTKKKEIGLLASFLYAISISALLIDRRLRMYAMFVPVFLSFIWMLYCFLESKYVGKISILKKVQATLGVNLVYAIPALVLGVLSLYLHLLTVNIAFIILAYAIVQMSITAKASKNWSRSVFSHKYAAWVFLFVLVLAGMYVLANDIFGLLTSSLNFPDNHYDYFSIVLKDYSHPLLAIAVFFAGVFNLLSNRSMRKEGLWAAVSFCTLLFLAVFVWDRNVGEQYIAFAQPLKIVIMASGIYAIAKFFEANLTFSSKKTVFLATIAFMLFILPNYGYFFEKGNIYHQTSKSDSPSYRKVFSYIMKYRTDQDIIITRDLRSYYLSGAHMHVENIGGEQTKDKLTLERLQNIVAQYPTGWVMLSDNDDVFVSHDAMQYIEKNMTKIDNEQVRGAASVYRWNVNQ